MIIEVSFLPFRERQIELPCWLLTPCLAVLQNNINCMIAYLQRFILVRKLYFSVMT